jgi:DNA-binding NarL/FixJ family response regulator
MTVTSLRCLKSDPGTRDIQTLLLTASSDPVDVEKGVEFGAEDYILKLKILLPDRHVRASTTTAGDSIVLPHEAIDGKPAHDDGRSNRPTAHCRGFACDSVTQGWPGKCRAKRLGSLEC